jgi:uncharacterized protein with HEPN domain
MRDDPTRVRHILECVEKILDWTKLGHDAFSQDPMMQSAVVHELEIIGEASKALSKEFRAEHAKIPWREIAGLRDVLVHDYDSIDAEEVWRVIERDIPALMKELSPARFE